MGRRFRDAGNRVRHSDGLAPWRACDRLARSGRLKSAAGAIWRSPPLKSTQTGLSASRRFCRQNEWRRPGRFQLANFFEPGVFEPVFDFVKTESVAALRVDEHLHGEHERMRRLGAPVVHEPFSDSDCAAGFQRAEGLLEQLPAALFAFAMQNMAERGDVVTVSEICFQQIASNKFESIADAKLLRDSFGRGNHSGPIDCGHAHAWRFLCKCNSPDAGAGGEIENAQFIFGFRHFQVICEFLRAAVAHWNDVLDELTEELCAFGFFIYGRHWPASARHLSYMQPFGGKPWQDRLEKSGEGARLVADEECFAFRRERIFSLSIFLQEVEADERVHDGPQTAHRRASLLADLLDGFRAVL